MSSELPARRRSLAKFGRRWNHRELWRPKSSGHRWLAFTSN
jgi:hypothetical protein